MRDAERDQVTGSCMEFCSRGIWQIPAEFYLAILNLELTRTPELEFIAEQIFALCAKSEDDPSEQADRL